MKDWKDKFYDSYINKDKKKGLEYLYKESPNSFIKFCNGDYMDDGENLNLNSLRKDKIWMSSPLEFNDPFDCAITWAQKNIEYQILDSLENEGWEKAWTKKIKQSFTPELLNKSNQNNERIKKEVDKVRKEIFTCCFSENSNLKNILMWSHYANNHKGFCMEFDKHDFFNFKSLIPMPIFYKEDFKPYWMIAFGMNEYELQLNTVYTKSPVWKYEKEWRIVEPNEKFYGKKGFLKDFIKPKNIYLGCKASGELKKDLHIICKEKEICLYEMYMKDNSFVLDFREFKSDE